MPSIPRCILNRMVQYCQIRFDVSFGALADATRRGVLEQLGRADASITALAERFQMTLTGMKKHVGVLGASGARHHGEDWARADLQARAARTGRIGGMDREVSPA